MLNSYFTINKISQGLYKDKGSKFISFAIPIDNIDQVKPIIDSYRKEYFDARHVCYAYMLNAERTVFRSNDDGEPSGTAGKPILGQINSFNLTNILIIVVRYFGGILLGTSGLITAYKCAAKDAIENAQIIEKDITSEYIIAFPYEIVNDIMRIIKDTDCRIIDQQYLSSTQQLTLSVNRVNDNLFNSKISKFEGYGLKRL